MNYLSPETTLDLRVEPIVADYAEADIAEAFDWKQIIRRAKAGRDLDDTKPWYLVVFRSQLMDGVDTSSLLEHDARAHEAALESTALIHYYADVPDEHGRALSFCLWTDREEAKQISKDSRHAAAAKMVSLYASYSLERYEVRHAHDEVTLQRL